MSKAAQSRGDDNTRRYDLNHTVAALKSGLIY